MRYSRPIHLPVLPLSLQQRQSTVQFLIGLQPRAWDLLRPMSPHDKKIMDPFETLSALEIGRVLQSLSATDIVIAGAVSRCWKDLTDYNATPVVFRRYFPEFNLGFLSKKSSWKEAGRQFRRLGREKSKCYRPLDFIANE